MINNFKISAKFTIFDGYNVSDYTRLKSITELFYITRTGMNNVRCYPWYEYILYYRRIHFSSWVAVIF